ncbi:unnamed protein product [Pleuronectes platessa]|uniref:V-SNARE coiled-coil homology domain-containing protein n=1 Tax=Pleuronectes platessa TaxID=8262 RepID=A0A9N7TVY2_PLEPL|nr:unnamed protein product [Pleuronectes platessa]
MLINVKRLPDEFILRVLIGQANEKLQQTQDEVEELKDIMMENINKAEERSVKLEDLVVRAELLLEEAKKFEKNTRKLIPEEDNKMRYVLIGIGVVATFVIIGLIIFGVTR